MWQFAPIEQLPELMEWVRSRGLGGALLIGCVYALATVLLIPGSMLTLAIGAVYGPWLGLAIVSPASVIGATLAFLLGRGMLFSEVEKKLGHNPKLAALSSAIERDGFKVLALVRLSPIFPYTIVNYAFGLTRISVGKYIFGSFIGMLPGTLMYVYLGAAVGDVAALASGELPTGSITATILKWVGLLATILLTLLITRRAKRMLNQNVSTIGKNPEQ